MQVEGLEGVEIIRFGEVGEDRYWLEGKTINCAKYQLRPENHQVFVIKAADGYEFVRGMFGYLEVAKQIEPRTAVLRRQVNTELGVKQIREMAEQAGFDLSFE